MTNDTQPVVADEDIEGIPYRWRFRTVAAGRVETPTEAGAQLIAQRLCDVSIWEDPRTLGWCVEYRFREPYRVKP